MSLQKNHSPNAGRGVLRWLSKLFYRPKTRQHLLCDLCGTKSKTVAPLSYFAEGSLQTCKNCSTNT